MADHDKPNIRAEIRLCLGLLTRLPVSFAGTVPPPVVARASRWFPLVGALIGLLSALGLLIASWIGLQPMAASLIAIAIGILVTGALHEDGLADVADGFGGGPDTQSKLDIMRDSRIGTYGVLALIISVALRISLLLALTVQSVGAAAVALVVAGALSRLTPVILMNRLPPARRDGMSVNAGTPDNETVRIACVLGLVSLLMLSGLQSMIVAILATLAACAAIGALARRQIGGQTGDVLGAGQQVTELSVLLVLAAVGP